LMCPLAEMSRLSGFTSRWMMPWRMQCTGMVDPTCTGTQPETGAALKGCVLTCKDDRAVSQRAPLPPHLALTPLQGTAEGTVHMRG
jgi:hypothetical protein